MAGKAALRHQLPVGKEAVPPLHTSCTTACARPAFTLRRRFCPLLSHPAQYDALLRSLQKMAAVWDQAVSSYHAVVASTDPRVKGWPLMGSPMTILSIIAGYVYFVKVWGPNWMKGREPFQIKNVLIAYNLIMVVLSTFFFFAGGRYTYLGPYNWFCQPVSYGTDHGSMAVVTLGWWYLLLKMTEFLDTVFFVFTKKFSHISLLHVVHHTTVAWTVWMGVNFGAGGQNAFFPFINCFVHMVMYTYYCLAAMGPEVRKYLWWKRYLTQFQMVQFVVGFLHAAVPVFYDCGFPPYFAYILMAEAVMLFFMFRNFYNKAYKASKARSQKNGHVTAPASDAVKLE